MDLKATKNLHKVFLLGSMKELQKTQEELQSANEQVSIFKEQVDILENEMLNLTDEKVSQEKETFKKFMLLLNSKKQKIKELRKELYPDEEGDFDESDDEPLKKSIMSDSETDCEEEPKTPKRKSLQLLRSDDDSEDDFAALTQKLQHIPAIGLFPKRVKLDDDVTQNRNGSPKPGTSKEQQEFSSQPQTSQDLLEML